MEQKSTRKKMTKKRQKKEALFSIDKLIPKAIKKLNIQSQFDEYNIQKRYSSLFGKEIAKISYPSGLINATLHISVANSAWLMQLSFMKEKIIKEINKEFKRKVVKDVLFKVGKVPKKRNTAKTGDKLCTKKVIIDEKTKKTIEEDVKNIKDEELKKAIVSAEMSYYKRKSKT